MDFKIELVPLAVQDVDRSVEFYGKDLGWSVDFDQTVTRLERINGAFTKRHDELTRFSDELAKVSAVEEYQALDAIFVENGAKPESESPSTSPSSS